MVLLDKLFKDRKAKKIAKVIEAGAVGVTSFESSALACGKPEKATFLSVILPAIKNPQDIYSDPDGKVYVNFGTDLKTINDISANPEKFKGRITGEVPVYQTMERLKALPDLMNTYTVEIDANEGTRKGSVSKVYKVVGRPLEKKELEVYVIDKCSGIPLEFKE